MFSPDNYDGPGFVLLGGGVGIGPLMSLADLRHSRRAPAILLFFGVARIEDATFREEIDTLATRLPLTVVYVVSDPPSGWTGERGRITTETLRRQLPRDHEELQYFICGPGAMQDAMEDALATLKVPAPTCTPNASTSSDQDGSACDTDTLS